MLQAIRDKAHGIFAWVMLLFVGIPFGLWGINNYFNGGKEKPIAVVGEREILEKDVNRAYENLVARMGSSDYDDKQLRHEALEQVINMELINQASRKEGLAVSEAEIRGYVQSQPYFQSEGKFDKDRLNSVLASQGMSPPQFAAQVKEQMLNEQFVRGITDTAIDISGDFKPTEEELKNLYEEQKAQYGTPEQRKVSHILIAADMDKEDEAKAAQTKAEALRARLSKGEDFSALAKESSDDKESAVKGGDLGLNTKEATHPDLANTAFALAKGEVSQPVKTKFGYDLIKVTELIPATTKKFEDVRAELEKNYRRNAAENKFYEAKQKLDEMSFEHKDSLEPLAKNLNLKIAQTGYFTREAGDGEAADALFRNAAFAPEVLEGNNGAALEIGTDKVYVLHLKDHQPASDKPLAEIKVEIKARLLDKMAQDATRKQAEQLLADVQKGKSLSDVAKSIGAAPNKATVKLAGKSDLPPALLKAVNKSPRPSAGKPSASLATLDNGVQAVFVLTEVKDGTLASVDPKELEMAKEYLGKNAGQAEFNAYLDYLRGKIGVEVSDQSKQLN